MKRWLSIALATSWVLAAAAALAHGGLHAGRGEVQLIEDVVYVNITPSAAMFMTYDTNGDGALDSDEVDAQRDTMRAYLLRGLSFVDQDGVEGEVFFEDLSLPGDAHHHGAEHAHEAFLRGTFRFRWASAPTSVTMRWDFGEQAPLDISAVAQLADEQGGTRSVSSSVALDADAPEATLW